MRFQLANEQFKTKKAAIDRVNSVRETSALGFPLTGSDREVVMAALALHKDFDQKVGCGIEHIEVGTEPQWKGRCFYVVRTDGSRTDFSYRECFNPSTPRQDVLSAMRSAISDQTWQAKLAAGDTHLIAHHAGTEFIDIAEEFLALHGLPELEPQSDNKFEERFTDRNLERSWQDFHAERSSLTLVTKEQHYEAHGWAQPGLFTGADHD